MQLPAGTAISYADTFQLTGAAAVVATGGPANLVDRVEVRYWFSLLPILGQSKNYISRAGLLGRAGFLPQKLAKRVAYRRQPLPCSATSAQPGLLTACSPPTCCTPLSLLKDGPCGLVSTEPAHKQLQTVDGGLCSVACMWTPAAGDDRRPVAMRFLCALLYALFLFAKQKLSVHAPVPPSLQGHPLR